MLSQYKGKQNNLMTSQENKQTNPDCEIFFKSIDPVSLTNHRRGGRGRTEERWNAFDHQRLQEHIKKTSCVALVWILIQTKQF